MILFYSTHIHQLQTCQLFVLGKYFDTYTLQQNLELIMKILEILNW